MLSATKQYSGTIEDKDRIRLTLEPVSEERIDGNQRWQELTGGYHAKATYGAGSPGEELTAEAEIAAEEVDTLTVQGLLARLDAEVSKAQPALSVATTAVSVYPPKVRP